MNALKSALVLCSGLMGFAANAEDNFLDWSSLLDLQEGQYKIEASDLILSQHIKTICQISPYTFALQPRDARYEGILKEANFLPVSEGNYVFAYFDENDQLLGGDKIPANKGPIRATRTFEGEYVCAVASRALIAVDRSSDFVKFEIINHP